MFGWIKRLWKWYERITLEQYDVSPIVYKIGTKKYIRVKKYTKGPVPRTRYEK